MQIHTYGYARVSSRDQNLDRQIDALVSFGVAEEDLFTDKASGKDFDRPNYIRLISKLKRGDTVVIKSIDRLGRNYSEILEQWSLISKRKGAAIVVIDMPLLDTRKEHEGAAGMLIADIVLQLLSYVAQVERENIRQRQAEGIASAKARGVKFGRPRKPKPSIYEKTAKLYLEGSLTRAEAARQLKISASTFDRWIRDDLHGKIEVSAG